MWSTAHSHANPHMAESCSIMPTTCPYIPTASSTCATVAAVPMLSEQSECTTHWWWGLLQALEEVHHLGLLFHILHLLRTSTGVSQAARELLLFGIP